MTAATAMATAAPCATCIGTHGHGYRRAVRRRHCHPRPWLPPRRPPPALAPTAMVTAAPSAAGIRTNVTTAAAATAAATPFAAAVGSEVRCRADRCGYDGRVVVEGPRDRSS